MQKLINGMPLTKKITESNVARRNERVATNPVASEEIPRRSLSNRSKETTHCLESFDQKLPPAGVSTLRASGTTAEFVIPRDRSEKGLGIKEYLHSPRELEKRSISFKNLGEMPAAGQYSSHSSRKKLHNDEVYRDEQSNTKYAGTSRERERVGDVRRTDHLEKILKDENSKGERRLSSTYRTEYEIEGFRPSAEKKPSKDIAPAKVDEGRILLPIKPNTSSMAGKPSPLANSVSNLNKPISSKTSTIPRTTILRTMEVPTDLDSNTLKRELAKEGFQVIRSHFESRPFTNKLTGKGFIEIKTTQDEDYMKSVLAKKGVKIAKK